jgi:hypothetical protein
VSKIIDITGSYIRIVDSIGSFIPGPYRPGTVTIK